MSLEGRLTIALHPRRGRAEIRPSRSLRTVRIFEGRRLLTPLAWILPAMRVAGEALPLGVGIGQVEVTLLIDAVDPCVGYRLRVH